MHKKTNNKEKKSDIESLFFLINICNGSFENHGNKECHQQRQKQTQAAVKQKISQPEDNYKVSDIDNKMPSFIGFRPVEQFHNKLLYLYLFIYYLFLTDNASIVLFF